MYSNSVYADLREMGQAARVLSYSPSRDSAKLLIALPVGLSPMARLNLLPEPNKIFVNSDLRLCGLIFVCVASSGTIDLTTHVRRSKEQFVTEIAEVDYIFGPASMPFLQRIVKGGTRSHICAGHHLHSPGAPQQLQCGLNVPWGSAFHGCKDHLCMHLCMLSGGQRLPLTCAAAWAA